jgi:hypothetical protein
MVNHRRGDANQRAVEKDRREQEDVRKVLAAGIGVVIDQKIAFPELI